MTRAEVLAKVLDSTLRDVMRVTVETAAGTGMGVHHWLRPARFRDDAWAVAVRHVAAALDAALAAQEGERGGADV